jgi:histidinol-phosphatase (PHP family)
MHLENYSYSLSSLKEFIEHGSKRGIHEFGFSEHSHHFLEFKDIYFRNVNMDDTSVGNYQRRWMQDDPKSFCYHLKEYVNLIEQGKQAGYPLRLGIEVCYFPGEEEALGNILEKFPFDYVIGSIHWLDGWGFDTKAEFWTGRDVDRVFQHYGEVIQRAIESELFDVIAHPYSCKAFGARPKQLNLELEYEHIAKLAKQHQVALELNSGLAYRYPAATICPPIGLLQIAANQGCDFSFGSDAHRSMDCGRGVAYLQQLAKEVGISEQPSFDLRQRKDYPLDKRAETLI